MTPEAMRLDKIPARLEATIHSLMGLSPMVTNADAGKDHRTYSNYGEARQAAYEDCLIPMQASFAECFTQHLLLANFTEGDRVRFDYSGIKCLLENETEVGERAGKAYQIYQGITRAEYREAIGYDYTEDDEVFFAETTAPPPEAPAEDDVDALDDDAELPAAAKRGHEHRHPFDERARTPGTPAGDIDEQHEDNTFNLPDGRPIRRGLKGWFAKQAKEILGTVPAIGEPMPASFPPLTDYDDPMASAMTRSSRPTGTRPGRSHGPSWG